MEKYPDPVIGQRFGKLTCVNPRTEQNKKFVWLAELLCDCGTTIKRYKAALHGKKPIKSCRQCYNVLPAGEASFRELYATCKRAALQRDLEFSISYALHRQLSQLNCYYCAIPPQPYNRYLKVDGSRRSKCENIKNSTLTNAWINVNGIDRKDSSVGYTTDNSVSCCYDCNIAKAEKSINEFVEHCRKIVKHQDSIKKAVK